MFNPLEYHQNIKETLNKNKNKSLFLFFSFFCIIFFIISKLLTNDLPKLNENQYFDKDINNKFLELYSKYDITYIENYNTYSIKEYNKIKTTIINYNNSVFTMDSCFLSNDIIFDNNVLLLPKDLIELNGKELVFKDIMNCMDSIIKIIESNKELDSIKNKNLNSKFDFSKIK